MDRSGRSCCESRSLDGGERSVRAGYGAEVVGYGVCDDEQYFYDFIDGLYEGLGADVSAKDTVRLVQAKGAGYGISRCGTHCTLLRTGSRSLCDLEALDAPNSLLQGDDAHVHESHCPVLKPQGLYLYLRRYVRICTVP